MADVDLRLEAKEDGVWISASSGEFSKDDVYDVLKRHGVTKYELKALEQFVRVKTGEPLKIAPRDAANEKDAKIVVRMPADNMSASVLVEPPFFTKPWPTEEEILDALKARSIVFGIDHDAIKDIIERRYIDDYAVVAKGAPPIPGKDAQIELLIDPNKPPEIREDEKVDFWSRSTLVTVRVGQQVAVKHPAVAGKEGKTILGAIVKPQGVKDTDFSFGEGLAKDERDPLSLVAVADGQLTEQRGKLAVLPQLSIAGDIDFSVGSVDFTGAVDIKGSVREGFHVVAQGNVYVHGMIEGADVDSQGDITVNGGVRGMGKGTISAVGDVTIGFADQATIRSGGSIMVKNAILHSYLYAQKSVVVMGGGQKSQIAGGRIEAGLDVSCQVLGSEMGTKTEVIVGLPPAQLERRRVLQAEVAKCEENLKKIEPNLVTLKKLEAAGQLDDQRRTMLMTLTKMKFQLQAALDSMSMEAKDLERRLGDVRDKGIVRVKDICHSGVQVTIRGQTYLVREACKYCAFVVEAKGITLKSFDYVPSRTS